MQGIQPQALTDRELARIAQTVPAKDVPPNWVAEILARFEARVDRDLSVTTTVHNRPTHTTEPR